MRAGCPAAKKMITGLIINATADKVRSVFVVGSSEVV
jgi:hypothetical protein